MAHPGRGPRQGLGPRLGGDERHARLFFALWPDDATRSAISRLACALQAVCGGRVTPANNIHLTLVFLGTVATARIAELCRAGDGVTAPCFGMDVGGANYWRHNRIVWAGPPLCPDALRTLVAELESALAIRGFDYDQRVYAPHITLLRDARCAPVTRPMTAIRWSVDGFVLVQSVRRARALVYEVLRHWPLGADTRTAGRVAQRLQDD